MTPGASLQGGSKEIFSTDPSSKETRLTLKKRFGFVKLAIAKGAQLVRRTLCCVFFLVFPRLPSPM